MEEQKKTTIDKMEEKVTFIFRNLRQPGQQHQYMFNGELVILKHGVKYTLARKYIEPLKTLWPDFKVEGDIDTEKTIKRADSQRFFAEPAEPDPSPLAEEIMKQKEKIKKQEVVNDVA
jgi:hypothetical protein